MRGLVTMAAAAAVIAVGGCAQRAADGTPLEECFLGICTPLTAQEQENYRRYHAAHAADRTRCEVVGRREYENSATYIIQMTALAVEYAGCKDDKCRGRVDGRRKRLTYSPAGDPVFRACMLDKGWADPAANGWKRGRASA